MDWREAGGREKREEDVQVSTERGGDSDNFKKVSVRWYEGEVGREKWCI